MKRKKRIKMEAKQTKNWGDMKEMNERQNKLIKKRNE